MSPTNSKESIFKKRRNVLLYPIHELTDYTVPFSSDGIVNAVLALRSQPNDVVESDQSSDLSDQFNAETLVAIVVSEIVA